MGLSVGLLVLLTGMCAALHGAAHDDHDAAMWVVQFEQFKRDYRRVYASVEEEARRLQHFIENMAKARELSRRNPQARFGVNNFSDLSAAEFKSYHSGEKHLSKMIAERQPVNDIFDEDELKLRGGSIDWRDYGAVTPVKNQGQCGCCWSFSSTGSIEGQWVIAGGQSLVSLSEQNLVSCDTSDSGCNGGVMTNAWNWLISNQQGQISTEDSYPFVSGDESVPSCAGLQTTGATITSYENLPQSESQMASWMYNNGPISIAVDATSWQTYNGGIITDCISSQIDHAVLAVGYDETAATPYWIIKNSWTATWGEGGYVWVAMGSNQCLIQNAPCTSVVGSSTNWKAKKRPPKVPKL